MSLPLVERGDKQGRQYLQAGLVFQTGPNGRPRRVRLVLRDLGLVVETRLGSLLTKDIFGVIPRPGEEVCRSWTYPSAFASPQSRCLTLIDLLSTEYCGAGAGTLRT